MVAPTFKVELDDGSGAFATDVSAYVDRKAGINISRGRQDEVGQIDAGTCSLTFNNTAGLFTMGLTAGIVVGRPVRVSLRNSLGVYKNRYTGFVNTWPVEWPGGKKVSKAAISAADRFARLSRRTLAGAVMANEITQDSPTGYWPLSDPAGSSTATDVSGNGFTLSRPGTGADPVFGVTTPPGSETSSAATFAAGRYLQTAAGPAYSATPGFVVAFATTVSDFLDHGILAERGSTVGSFYLIINNGSLYLSGSAFVGVGGYNDGLPHVVAVRFTTASLADVYIDGVLTDAGVAIAAPITSGIKVGQGHASDSFPFVGTIAHAAAWTTSPSAARMLSISGAMQAYANERSDQRIARLAGYAKIATADMALEVGVQRMGPLADLDGTGVIDAMRQVEAAEQGLLFINASGQLAFQNRSHRYNRASSATFSAAAIDPGSRFQGDDQGLVNQCTVTRDGGSPQVVRDTASIAAYELYPEDLTLALLTDDEAVQIASWRVGVNSEPAPRISTAKVDLLTNSTAISDAMLDLEIGDRFTITALPAQAPAASVSLFVEGWTEVIGSDEWSMDFNTSPSDGYAGTNGVWQLDVNSLDGPAILAL